MNERTIRRLIRLVEESEVDELEVRRWWRTVRIVKKREGSGPATVEAQRAPSSSPAPPAEAAGPSAAEQGETKAAEEAAEEAVRDLHVVESPMVGTFYRAPSPDAPSYVEVGDEVRVGQTLCILEAMKLMNELESEVSGTVRKILAENGDPVEYGQPLFEIERG